MKIYKVEEGFCDGAVMYHEFISKTPAEAAEMRKKIQERAALKQKRKAEQEENVARYVLITWSCMEGLWINDLFVTRLIRKRQKEDEQKKAKEDKQKRKQEKLRILAEKYANEKNQDEDDDREYYRKVLRVVSFCTMSLYLLLIVASSFSYLQEVGEEPDEYIGKASKKKNAADNLRKVAGSKGKRHKGKR